MTKSRAGANRSETMKRYWSNPGNRLRSSQRQQGRVFTAEHRRKLSEAMRGGASWNKGKKTGPNPHKDGCECAWHREDKRWPSRKRIGYRELWENEHGPIPKGYEVHHKNGDHTDDRLENLEMKTVREHRRLHAAERARAKTFVRTFFRWAGL